MNSSSVGRVLVPGGLPFMGKSVNVAGIESSISNSPLIQKYKDHIRNLMIALRKIETMLNQPLTPEMFNNLNKLRITLLEKIEVFRNNLVLFRKAEQLRSGRNKRTRRNRKNQRKYKTRK